MKVQAIVLAVLALPGGAVSAQEANRFGFEAGLSTLGAFVAPTYAVNDKLTLRAPLYFGSVSGDFDVDGNTVDASFAVNNVTLMADFKPWGNAVRLSGGIGVGGYDLDGTATDLTLDGNTYAGVSTVALGQKEDIAPILSVGFHREFANGMTLFGDIGGRIATYEVSVVTAGALTPAEQADLEASIADYNSDLAKVGVTPFVTLGLGFRF